MSSTLPENEESSTGVPSKRFTVSEWITGESFGDGRTALEAAVGFVWQALAPANAITRGKPQTQLLDLVTRIGLSVMRGAQTSLFVMGPAQRSASPDVCISSDSGASGGQDLRGRFTRPRCWAEAHPSVPL